MHTHSSYDQRLFPTFDPITEEHIGYKKRHAVHVDGDWHRGVQANVVRRAGDSFEILMQKRTLLVDIAGEKYDQSLATQMLDEDALDEDRALHRGLDEELGIHIYKKKKLESLKMRIIKTYDDQLGILNRELISIFIVEVDPSLNVRPSSVKVANVEWLEWQQFLQFFEGNRHRFTKTASFYFTELFSQIEHATWELLRDNNDNDTIPASELLVIHQNTDQISTRIYKLDVANR